MHALICDDDATVRLVARRVLEEHFGCTVTECDNGSDALEALAGDQFSFAILDVDMPGRSGLETLREVRASEALASLPVIIMTAERDQSTVVQLLQLGVSDYIVKPLKRQSFVDKVEALLRSLPGGTPACQGALLPSGHSVLVVDGDAGFRRLVARYAGAQGEVEEVATGAAALMAFYRSPAGIVLIGSELGVMSPERVAVKLREVAPTGVRLVRIVDAGDQTAQAPFDEVLERTDDGASLAKSLRALAPVARAS